MYSTRIALGISLSVNNFALPAIGIPQAGVFITSSRMSKHSAALYLLRGGGDATALSYLKHDPCGVLPVIALAIVGGKVQREISGLCQSGDRLAVASMEGPVEWRVQTGLLVCASQPLSFPGL
jgi:hypothetical protein